MSHAMNVAKTKPELPIIALRSGGLVSGFWRWRLRYWMAEKKTAWQSLKEAESLQAILRTREGSEACRYYALHWLICGEKIAKIRSKLFPANSSSETRRGNN